MKLKPEDKPPTYVDLVSKYGDPANRDQVGKKRARYLEGISKEILLDIQLAIEEQEEYGGQGSDFDLLCRIVFLLNTDPYDGYAIADQSLMDTKEVLVKKIEDLFTPDSSPTEE